MNEPILEAKKLCKTFGSLVAVQDVSLDINKNEIHAIIGPNGAGKSTLIAQNPRLQHAVSIVATH